MLAFRLLIAIIVSTTAGRTAPDDVLLAPMRRYYADNGRHILFDDLREIVRLQGWGLARPRFKELIDRLDSQNGGDQTKLNAFFTVLPSRGRLSAASEGPSNQQVIDYIREDLERGRSEVLRHFNISRKRAKRLVASARSQLTDRDIVNFLRPREDWSKGAVLEKLRITESRYARCVAELRAATPVDRTCVLRFLRAVNLRRRKKDAMARFHISSSLRTSSAC